MTRIGELPAEHIALNPDAPVPPFPVWLRVPADWSQLDTNPGTWLRNAQELVDVTFRGARLPSPQRKAALAVIEDLVADCQRAGAALSLLTLGRTADGEMASAGIHLAFASDGRAASLGRVHDTLPSAGTVTEIATGAGPAVVHRDRMTMMVPGTAIVKVLTSIQLFLPLDGTSWTIVLSTASAFPQLTDDLEQLLRTVGASIRLTEEAATVNTDVTQGTGPPTSAATAGATSTATPAADAAEPTAGDVFEAAPTLAAPGIERGFGTLVVRRIGDLPEGSR